MERITYYNEENGYIVIKVKAKSYSDLITVIGKMASVNVGSNLKIDGEWEIDKKYGKQFKAVNWSESLPTSLHGIEKYLGGGSIKGIGEKYAKRIVASFQERTLEVIEKNPHELLSVEGIGIKRVEKIKKSWEENKEIKNIMIFLHEHGVSASHAIKIHKTYGSKSIEVVSENPYKLADDVHGMGFKTADLIASKLGIDKESYIRCRSGILYTLSELSNERHCYAEHNQLVEKAVELLDIEEPKIVMSVSNMRHEKEVIPENNNEMIYLPSLYYCEVGTARLIKKISVAPRRKKIVHSDLNNGINYDETQLEAIKCAVNSKFMVLTGGPGTGKTTTTAGIIEIFRKNGFEVLAAAPTGRAAKRMNEATGLESKTIHRLLEYRPPQGYQKNDKDQLSGDVLIVDEASMIDIVLMYNLLKAIPPEMSVILIGDVDQLPSVGAGNVLRDIIDSGCVPVVKLEKIFRQAQGSAIIRNAHKANKGDYLELKNTRNSDFFFIEQDDNSLIPQLIVDLCGERLPKSYNIDPLRDIQVLCPMQRSETGVMNLNIVLQNALNKNSVSIKRGGVEYRLNDKVMQIRNNYDKEVMNGDIGYISSVNLEDETLTVLFDGRPVEYEKSETDDLVLAYSSTIHKAQGSEFPIVIMPISMSHFIMLQRNLLYTAITRAKKLFILVGSKKAVYISIKNDKVAERNTWLKERLMH